MEIISVGERILEILNEKNMTQYMLAKRTGMSPSSINSIIRRGNSPTLSVVERLCAGLGVTVGYFLKEKAICGDLDSDGGYDFYEEMPLSGIMNDGEEEIRLFMDGEIREEHYESRCNFFKCRNREKCFEDMKKELFKE